MILKTRRRRYKERKVIKKFLFLPIIYQGNFFWMLNVRIEKGYNGLSTRIINIQKIK